GFPPISYRWQFNGTNLIDDARIFGSSSNKLSVFQLNNRDSGNYKVVITDKFASVASEVVELSVVQAIAPVVSNGPNSITINTGQDAIFKVLAQGSPPPSIQWYRDGLTLRDDAQTSGSATDTLAIHRVTVDDAGNYWAIASNSSGWTNSAR